MKIIKHPDGRYKNQDNIFINKIYSFDKRYKLIRPIIKQKIEIFEYMYLNTVFKFNNITGFYFLNDNLAKQHLHKGFLNPR